LGYKSYKVKVLKNLNDCKRELCKAVGVLAVAEVQNIVPIDTGNLKKCIVSEIMDKNKGVYIGVTPEAPYATYVEKGTSKQQAQPYLEPGIVNSLLKISTVADKIYKAKMGEV